MGTPLGVQTTAVVSAALGVNWLLLCKNCLAGDGRTQTKRDAWTK
jgi:hypothetical protein